MIKGSSMAKWFLLKTAITATYTTANPAASTAFVSRAVAATRQQGLPVSPLLFGKRRRNYSTTATTNSKSSSHRVGKSSLFESMRTGYYRKTNSDEISLQKLLEKAASVRFKSHPTFGTFENLNDANRLFFSSSYDASGSTENDKMTRRGFSNWIVPGRIMVGQYPGRVPETNSPTEEEVIAHIRRVLFGASEGTPENNTKKDVCFISLQSELPPQDDNDSWNKYDGNIYLAYPESRKEWPNAFSHYAPTVEEVLKGHKDDSSVSVRYIHHPIEDLSVPSNSKNLRLLLWKILDFLDNSSSNSADEETITESMVYIHCWGGRGRAGLTACCLLTLLGFAAPSSGDNTNTAIIMDVETIFDVVQTGYSSRLGSENMLPVLSRSPQTDSQRNFVRKFFQEVSEEIESGCAS